ncbi:hypothetical protein BH11ARM2_BH11ARM2_35460 [soil metagenome]
MFGAVEAKGRKYVASIRCLAGISGPVFTTEACFAEAMHLAGKRIGFVAQTQVWDLFASYHIEMHYADMANAERLMRLYADVPMDFADATLVALASEDRRIRIATFDSDFLAYRREDGTPVPLANDALLGWD